MFLLIKETILERPYVAFACIPGLILVVWRWLECYKTSNSGTRAPPRVPYWLPWIGSAVEMGKDPDAFFKRAR